MKVTYIGALVLLCASPAAALTPKEVYKKAGPAVTLVLGSDDGKQGSGGTGSIITPDGKMITNAHVVLSNTTNQPFRIIYVFLKPDRVTGDNSKDLARRYKAHVLAYSPPEELDLALVQIDQGPADLPTISFADPDAVDVGDEVVAIGHPEQGGLWTLTTGAISTVIANYNHVKGKNVFQTEASVNRGNSGGPLLDTDGNMVGINTMIARQDADGVAITSVNFSLKSSVAVSWLAVQGMGLAYAPKSATTPQITVALAPQASQGGSQPGTQNAPTPPQAVAQATPPAAAPSSPQTPSHPDAAAPPPHSAPTAAAPAAAPVQPPATIVVAEKPPSKPAEVRNVADQVQKGKQAAPVVKGEPLDPAKAKPQFVTEKRPFNIDDLRRQQMKDLEDMMNDMRSKKNGGPQAGDGMGLW